MRPAVDRDLYNLGCLGYEDVSFGIDRHPGWIGKTRAHGLLGTAACGDLHHSVVRVVGDEHIALRVDPDPVLAVTRASMDDIVTWGLECPDCVYLNASFLGLSRAETDAVYDDVVGFAELEDFMDTAVKFYSSGMLVRLGFAVAIHVDPSDPAERATFENIRP